MKKNEKKCYEIIDKVTDDVLCILQATNERDCVRNMVLSGFFKVNRLKDTKIIECEMPKEKKEISLEKTLKDLEMNFEDKAEKIEGDPKKTIENIKKEE